MAAPKSAPVSFAPQHPPARSPAESYAMQDPTVE